MLPGFFVEQGRGFAHGHACGAEGGELPLRGNAYKVSVTD